MTLPLMPQAEIQRWHWFRSSRVAALRCPSSPRSQCSDYLSKTSSWIFATACGQNVLCDWQRLEGSHVVVEQLSISTENRLVPSDITCAPAVEADCPTEDWCWLQRIRTDGILGCDAIAPVSSFTQEPTSTTAALVSQNHERWAATDSTGRYGRRYGETRLP